MFGQFMGDRRGREQGAVEVKGKSNFLRIRHVLRFLIVVR